MNLPHGDYSQLARDYARYRPAYAPSIADALLGLVRCAGPVGPQLVDVGAGTGIWTRMLAAGGRRVIAIEPNAEMRSRGQRGSADCGIEWRDGSAESSGLPDGSCDLLTMASSLHWADFDRAVAEIARVLRPGGVFAALWNTRHVEADPLLVEIEAELERLVPHLERMSSGRSKFCETLTERLWDCAPFSDVLYLEGRHVEHMTPERYLGIWRSVNDVRVQAGEEVFSRFLDFVRRRTEGLEIIEATYRTRAWAARKGDRRPSSGSVGAMSP